MTERDQVRAQTNSGFNLEELKKRIIREEVRLGKAQRLTQRELDRVNNIRMMRSELPGEYSVPGKEQLEVFFNFPHIKD